MGRRDSNREYYKKEIERMKEIRKEYGDGDDWKDYPTSLYKGLNKELLMKDVGSYEELMYKSRVLVDRNTFSKYVSGEQAPNAEVLIRLAYHANCRIDDIINYDKEEDPNNAFNKPELIMVKEGVVVGLANPDGSLVYFDTRPYVKSPSVEAIKLDFDSPILYTRRGTVLICLFDPDEKKVKSGEDGEIYALMKGEKADWINSQDPTKRVFKDVQRLYITKIKKVKNDYGVQNIKSDVYSFIDADGKLQFQRLSWINEHMKSRIVMMINEFDY